MIQNERARSVAGLRKLSETPNQTRDFTGRATSTGSTPRGPNNANLEAGIGQDDIGHVTLTLAHITFWLMVRPAPV